MSVLKTEKATHSRMRGIFRYLLQTEGQREKKEILERILSPDKLTENAPSPHPMFRDAIRESLKCGLLIEIEKDNYKEIAINPDLPGNARNPQLGDKLLPNTLTDLFFAADNQDEEDFGLVIAWYLTQDVYDAPGNWREIEQRVGEQQVGDLLKMTSDSLFSQLENWICYLGFAWGHAAGGRKIVPDPTAYIKQNLEHLFDKQVEKEISIREFISRLAQKCPLFETGRFRETIEARIGHRQPNYLSTGTALALFRLQDDGYIQLKRKSDADLMILPQVNSEERVSHIIYQNL